MKLIWPLANAREVPYSLSTPGGQIWAYFCSTHSDFKDIWADFQNLTYLSMQLCHWQKFQKLHIESLCISGAQNCAYFRSTNRGIWDTDRFLKIFIFRNKTWLLSKVRGVAHTLLFYPGGGSELSLCSFCGQRFLRYRPIFKNCHIWEWNLAIVKVALLQVYVLMPGLRYSPIHT